MFRWLRERRQKRARETAERREQLRRKAGAVSPQQPLESLLPGEPYRDGVGMDFANVLIAQEAEATRRAGSADGSHSHSFSAVTGNHNHSHSASDHAGAHSHSYSHDSYSHSHNHDSGGSSFDSGSSGGDSSW